MFNALNMDLNELESSIRRMKPGDSLHVNSEHELSALNRLWRQFRATGVIKFKIVTRRAVNGRFAVIAIE